MPIPSNSDNIKNSKINFSTSSLSSSWSQLLFVHCVVALLFAIVQKIKRYLKILNLQNLAILYSAVWFVLLLFVCVFLLCFLWCFLRVFTRYRGYVPGQIYRFPAIFVFRHFTFHNREFEEFYPINLLSTKRYIARLVFEKKSG